MSKDTLKSALDKGGASSAHEGPDLVVPSVTTQRDKWNRGNIAYALAAKDSDALDRFCQEHFEIEHAIRERKAHHQETGKSIGEGDAVVLASRVKNLHLSHPFDGRGDHVAFLTGQCLKLKEGQIAGDVHAAFVSLELANPPPDFPEWRGTCRTIKLVVPAALTTTFGTQSLAWLGYRSKDFAREYERKGFPPGSRSARLFVGGSFGFSLDPVSSQQEAGAVSVVPAPDEITITEHVKCAPSKADYWAALVKAAKMLREHRQPLGDALSDWAVDALDGQAKQPDGRTSAKRRKNVLRDYAIIEAVTALARCGMKATRNEASPPRSACDAVADAFEMKPERVTEIWKAR